MESEDNSLFTYKGLEFEWDSSRDAWSTPLGRMAPYARLYLKVLTPKEPPSVDTCEAGLSYRSVAQRLGVEAAEYLTSEAERYIRQAYDVAVRPTMFSPFGVEIPWETPRNFCSVLMRGVFDIDTTWIVRMRGMSLLTWRVDHSESRMPRRAGF